MYSPVLGTLCWLVLLAQSSAQQNTTRFYKDKADLLYYLNDQSEPVRIHDQDGWSRRRQHILQNMQIVMGPLRASKNQVSAAMRVESETVLDKIIRKKISFAVEDGDRLTAWLLVPRSITAQARNCYPAALCLHQTTAIGKNEPAGLGGKKNLAYALELAEQGYVTFAPDYPNFGDYKIDVYRQGYQSATMKGIWNHMRAIDILCSLPFVDSKRIACVGHSLGGHNALFLAAFDERVHAVITSCGFTSFPKYYGGNLKGWSHPGYMPRIATIYHCDPVQMPFDFPEILGAIAPRPLFINAPLRDANFDVSGVRDCVASATPIYKLYGAEKNLMVAHPAADHDFPTQVCRQAYDFLARMMPSQK